MSEPISTVKSSLIDKFANQMWAGVVGDFGQGSKPPTDAQLIAASRARAFEVEATKPWLADFANALLTSLAEEAEREAEQLRKHGESIPVTKHYEYAQISNKAAVWSDRAAWLRSKGVERK